MIWPALIAHADWGTDPRKRQVAVARSARANGDGHASYVVESLAPAGGGRRFFDRLREAAIPAADGQALTGQALTGQAQTVVAETYPREYYRHLDPAARWSKRRRADRLRQIPGLLTWAESLPVEWDASIRPRVESRFSDDRNGEDEFDAVVGLIAMIAVVTGALDAGVPADDPAVLSTEGWILGRAADPP